MALPLILAGAGAIANIAGGLFGDSQAEEDQARAMEAQKRALEIIQGVRVPTVEDQKIFMEMYESAGELSPEMEAAIGQANSKLGEIKSDPRLKQAEMSALARIENLGKTGFGAQEKADMAELDNQVARDARGKQEAILMGKQAQGMGGSGVELAAQLAASQGATDRLASGSRDIAAQANARALEAISRGADMAGNMDARDFDQKSAVARAQDEIAQFNTRNRQDVQMRNTDSVNSARKYNLDQKRTLQNANVDKRNYAEEYNKELKAKTYNMEMEKAKAEAGQHEQMASAYDKSAQATRNKWSKVGNAVGGGLSAASSFLSKPDAAPDYSDNDGGAAANQARKMKNLYGG